jgi:hypothetical protein
MTFVLAVFQLLCIGPQSLLDIDEMGGRDAIRMMLSSNRATVLSCSRRQKRKAKPVSQQSVREFTATRESKKTASRPAEQVMRMGLWRQSSEKMRINRSEESLEAIKYGIG